MFLASVDSLLCRGVSAVALSSTLYQVGIENPIFVLNLVTGVMAGDVAQSCAKPCGKSCEPHSCVVNHVTH